MHKNTPLRILLIGEVPKEFGGKQSGGISTHVLELAQNLLEGGYRVSVFADGLSKRRIVVKDIEVWGAPREGLKPKIQLLNSRALSFLPGLLLEQRYDLRNSLRLLWWNRLYRDMVESFHPDLVHSHLTSHPITTLHKRSYREIPLIFTVHSFHSVIFSKGKEKKINLKITRANIQQAQGTILVAPGLIDQSKSFGIQLPNQREIIVNPLDLSLFKMKTEPLGGEPTLLFVGLLTGRKGEEDLLKASKVLHERGVKHRVVIVGDGPNRAKVEQLRREFGLGETVKTLGTVSREKVAELLQKSDFLVLPSYSESFPYSIIEAYATGTPVITTYESVEKAADLLFPGPEFGVLTNSGDPHALAKAIEESIKRKWDHKKIALYAKRFSWEETLPKVVDFYSRVVGASKDPFDKVS